MMDEQPHCICEEADGTVTGFMCLTDFECELGGNLHGNTVYPSLEALKSCRPSCAEDCGIAEVKVTGVRIAQHPQTVNR